MNIQFIISTTLLLSSACNTQKLETTGGNCPDPENVKFDGNISASILQSMVDPNNPDSVFDLSCEEMCIAMFNDESTFPDEIQSCDFSFEFDVLPDDFFDWEPTEKAGELNCEGMIYYACMGRRPQGHLEQDINSSNIGAHFACAAHLEAASVTSFLELAAQLEKWSAPESLISRCLFAAGDERVHARLFGRLARDYGVQPEVPTHKAGKNDLLSIALHNAVEGCIFETWSALIAAHQAQHIQDSTLRRVYTRVAIDEAKHGQLAWDIHHWLMCQLSETDRRSVEKAQQAAFVQLREIAQTEAASSFLGRPTSAEALHLSSVFIEQLKQAA